MANFTNMNIRRKHVSYNRYETNKFKKMEEELMKRYDSNFSQLHKDLVSREYQILYPA